MPNNLLSAERWQVWKHILSTYLRTHKAFYIAFGILFIFPFIYLFPYVMPIKGHFLRIGNDFDILYFNYKVYLLDLLNHHRLPLWSPSEAGGYPFFSSPFTQAFYPLNLPLVLFYRLANGYTILDYQRFTIVGISIFSTGLFAWLRELNVKLKIAFFAALVIAVSFKSIELIRFPNAVHTACWYPWILFVLTKLLRSESTKHAWGYGSLLFMCGFCFFTGGYPYYVYYAIFLFPPYLLLLWLILAGQNPDKEQKTQYIKNLLIGLISGALLVCVIAPYYLQIYKLLSQTVDRGGGNFNYSTESTFNFQDTLGSLVYPPVSQAEGWYHFSFASLFLIVMFLFGKNTESNMRQAGWLKFFLLGWIVVISYISYGRESILFQLLWRILPGFSSLRIWGRMNIILLPLLAWLLALAYQHFEDRLANSTTQQSRYRKDLWLEIGVVSITYFITLMVQLYFIFSKTVDNYWTDFFVPSFISFFTGLSNLFAVDKGVKIQLTQANTLFTYYILGMAFFSYVLYLYYLFRSMNDQTNSNRRYLSLLLISITTMYAIAPWMWAENWAKIPKRTPLNLMDPIAQSFHRVRKQDFATISLNATYNIGVIPNWYFKRYVDFLENTQNEKQATKVLLGAESAQKIFFSNNIYEKSVQDFIYAINQQGFVYTVNTYSGDYLSLSVVAPTDGFVSFIDNWDPAWKATVDSHPVEIQLLFKTFKSVPVKFGAHRVEFIYCPSFFEIFNPSCAKIK